MAFQFLRAMLAAPRIPQRSGFMPGRCQAMEWEKNGRGFCVGGAKPGTIQDIGISPGHYKESKAGRQPILRRLAVVAVGTKRKFKIKQHY
jgi:hypothetical protein